MVMPLMAAVEQSLCPQANWKKWSELRRHPLAMTLCRNRVTTG